MFGNWLRENRSAVLAASLTCWVTTPVWGDDTEIFFGNFDGTESHPNILFIMDTSGSMQGRPDGSSERKIDIVKDALKQLASELNGVNLGLMRFSNPGGPVLYPVTFIDKEITPFGEGPQTVVTTVNGSDGDATQVVSSGAVSLDGNELSIGTGVETTTTRYRILATGDDADEGGTGGNRLDFTGSDDRVGIRFQSVEIPDTAVINDARVSVTVGTTAGDTGSVAVSVRGDLPPAAPFSSVGLNSASRSDLTSASIQWLLDDPDGTPPSEGAELVSPNLAPLMTEILADDNWRDGCGTCNDIVFLLDRTDGGRRQLVAWDDDNNASELTVNYTLDPGSSNTFLTGLQFTDLGVPQNAAITSATLELTPTNSAAAAVDVDVLLESSTDPAVFAETTNNLSLRSGSSGTVSSVDWTVGSRVSLDVTAMIESKVATAGWCAGDAMSMVLSSSGERLGFASFEGDAEAAPVLRVTYDPDSIVPGATCVRRSFSKRIARGSDDQESYNASGSNLFPNRDRMSIKGDDWAALRFDEFNLPSDAVVKDARLYLTARKNNNKSGVIKLSIEDVADSAALSGGISGRSWTGSVNWSITGSDSSWRDQRAYASPDISSLVTSVLSRGFSSGNALTLRIDHVSGTARQFYTFERSPVYTARLEVVFESAGNDVIETARSEFIRAVDSLNAEGWTPVQDTMYEAFQYYAGKDVVWGKYRGGHDQNGSRIGVRNGGIDEEPFWYTRVSDTAAITTESFGGAVRPPGCTSENLSSTACDDPNGAGLPEGEYLLGSPKYKSPVQSACQFKSHIVLLTDGFANEPHSESLIKSVIGSSSCTGNTSQKCVVELARHMSETDLSDTFEGDQRVVTHTIGFDINDPWLGDIAAASNDPTVKYYRADNASELAEAFTAIAASAFVSDTSFVAPVAAINQTNRLTNLNDVYFAVFKPSFENVWSGNLKRYRLGESGTQKNVILDQNDAPAVDPGTGFFLTTAQSYWSSVIDGASVTEGGALENLPAPGSRRLYTDVLGAGSALTAADNRLVKSNAEITAALLGVDEADRDTVIDWIRGVDTEDANEDGSTTDDRPWIADPLHSRPVAVTYGSITDADGDLIPDVTLFFGSNAGILHAINAQSGQELFGYLPADMLDLQDNIRTEAPLPLDADRLYGLDGSPAVWTKNSGTSAILPAEGDHVYLYVGQRRGGQNYYAIDVTNRGTPKVMWQISGGSGDFEDLGQTWARPIPGRLKIGTEDVDVLYISGGYDPANDDETTRNSSADVTGNAIFVVNATTGDLLWSVGADSSHTLEKSEMIHSIPATAAVYDVNLDGYDDGLFVGDTGGQVWRFDFDNGQAVENLATGGVIARMGTTGESDAATNRRFYHSPDVALGKVNGQTKLIVTLGSGSRPSPLSETVDDRFYAIFQDAVFGPPDTYVALSDDSDFYDATDNILQSPTATVGQLSTARSDLAAASGWFIDFNRSGEKVLSTPLAFDNRVAFVTYTPESDPNSCVAKAGTSRNYVVNLEDATATEDVGFIEDPDDPQPPPRSVNLNTPSIVEEPVFICTGEGCDYFAGPEQPPVGLGNDPITRSYWRQDQ